MYFSMTKSQGIATFAAAGLALALGGCLSGADQSAEERQARANSLKFIQESSAPISTQVAAEGDNNANPFHGPILDNLEAIGCPKLANLFRDMTSYQGSVEQPFPQSFHDYLSCFGIDVNATIHDIDGVYAKFENPKELLDCICGGSGLSDLLEGKFEVFSAQAAAAAESFDAANASAATSADISNAKTADDFDASQSEAAGNFEAN